MEKPIVFLSHSVKNKTELAELKALLDKRAAGSLDFFLSSDGQSIRFGRNWVVRISDALTKAKLMFVFLSPESADSKWIHFEAGCAYANGIRVIPVCLPRMDFSQLNPPLGLLQGFNLHSYEALANIARTCNEVFQLKIDEVFTRQQFESVFANSAAPEHLHFRNCNEFIESIYVSSDELTIPATQTFDPLPKLEEIIKSSNLEAVVRCGSDFNQRAVKQLELPGCLVSLTQKGTSVKKEQIYEISFSLSPELFHINAPLLDKWYAQAGFSHSDFVGVRFELGVLMENTRPRLTTKLHKGGIRLVTAQDFDFGGLQFSFSQNTYVSSEKNSLSLNVKSNGNLFDSRLPKLIERLFEFEVFFEDPFSPPPR